MSEVQSLELPEVQYILDDSQLILDSENGKAELADIIFSDGTTAYVLEENSEENTLVWQDEDLNYYINDENGQLQLVGSDQIENESNTANSDVTQYTDDFEEILESSEVVYLNETNLTTLEQESYEITEIQTEDPFLETFQVENDANLDDTSQIQYAILKDGKLHVDNYNAEITFINLNEENGIEDNKIVEMSKITGKNLITGQQMSLNGYIEKIKKKNKETSRKKGKKEQIESNLESLVNKKLMLGKTDNGKILVGKIKSIKKVENESSSNDFEKNLKMAVIEKNPENSNIAGFKAKKILIQEKIVTKECFEHIVKTLNGLMDMESIKKKLQQKCIIVKVVEKHYLKPKEYTKEISYCSGFMIEEYSVNENNEIYESWKFMLDKNMKGAIFGTQENEDEEDIKYNETVNVTIILTYEKTGERHIQVILNPRSEKECLFCGREFKSSLQLRVHQKYTHKHELYECKICGKQCNKESSFEEHKKTHAINLINAHDCTECSKTFLSATRLRRHMNNVHFPKPVNITEVAKNEMFACEICQKAFPSKEELEFHKNTHFTYRFFTCETCGKKFSRHSNLLRHIEIHQGSDAAHKCTICGCSYHYASSLTRHIVQNHLPVTNTQEIVAE